MRNVREREKQAERLRRKKLDRIKHRLLRLVRRQGKTEVALNKDLDITQNDFDIFQKSLDWYTCDICKKRQIYCRSEKKPCKDCHIYTSSNDLDPKDVPSELLDLTFVEQQVIARVHPVLSLYKVKNVHYKYLGQIINFPQNVQELCDILPNTVENLSGVLAIRCKDSDGFRDFFIRKQKVLNALVWLKANNPFYYDIQISQDRIDLLPDNGCIYNQVRGFNDDGEKSCSITDGDLVITVDDLPEMDSEEELIVYKDVPDLSYVSQKDQLNLNENVLVWPSIRRTPINEFSSPGYITMSFPHLFCWGTCDYSNRKDNTVSLHKYIEHLMLYKDGRFARDPRFRFFMLNSMMRWQTLRLGNIFVKQNSLFKNMTVCHLKQYLKKNPNHVKEILFYSRRIKSTKAYWKSKCAELEDMVKQIGPPTIFFTLSSADYRWKELFRLLGENERDVLNYSVRSRLLSDNPLIVTTFFKFRVQYFLKKCFCDNFNVKDYWYRIEFQSRGSCHVHGVAWFNNAPDIRNLNTPKDKQDALDYLSKLVSCHNPDLAHRPNLIHPCSKNLSEVNDLAEDLAELVNQIQRHTCSKQYCLKKRNRIVKDWG
ncbi:hypothetical protein KUF71_025921 [Frankliniella fusca]|uniref:Helitron helicase-like domain-containing protein n=1 Tax=Frankliniella fusca TaxID=407009 RepID=A0AAE1LET9_9NEOP|nr:hypothetical protein KUF71_025921 [Frankliniella fusca]